MSAPTTNAAHPHVDTWRMAITLAAVSLVSGFLIVLAYGATQPRILENKKRAIDAAVFQVLPGAETRTTYVAEGDALQLVDLPSGTGQDLYAGYDANGKLVGVAIEAAGLGYWGVVRVIYGYSLESQTTTGIAMLDGKDTPRADISQNATNRIVGESAKQMLPVLMKHRQQIEAKQ